MMEQETINKEETPSPDLSHEVKKPKWLIVVGAIMIVALAVASFVLLQTKQQPHVSESQDVAYGGPFYRKDNKVFADDPQNDSINNLELPDADPDSFIFLQGLAGYDKDYFHYLRFGNESRSYLPVRVPISSAIKKLFDLVKTPGEAVKIVWSSNTDVEFENVTFRRLSEYGVDNALDIEMYELLNNGTVIGYLWTNGLNKTNVAQSKLYLYTDFHVTGYKRAVYEVAYGNQPELILDIDPDDTTFKPGGSKIYSTKSYNSLDLYEYDTVTRTERKIPVQNQNSTTSSSRITLSPNEKYLLVQSREENGKTSTLLVDINTGTIEVVRDEVVSEKEAAEKGRHFPFAVSPSNDKVFFLTLPYEGYVFANPSYIQKDATTGVWSSELKISSINMEVGGGWNINTGQWSLSPSGRYLAVADATEDSIYSCGGYGDTPRAHNLIKIFDLETLTMQILISENPDVNFKLNPWALDESGIFATKRTVEMNPTQDCGEPTGEGTQEFYSR
ncbi:hypothetical protein FJZ48_04335 [Candidatus Uhrbacteria bacterium]|nr:hypothetical protein [Candidatus Uhrbacteria bacterium]